ncbi:single-stranded DNA-binding protein [Acidaminococcus massiliensis]|uniref:single-stranded DNA-binding protein n=1 Tax=Acidaminococcus massiliensis TaxID=1852375 RepID=UPI00094F09F9|nr:single-stranded DNA-binding protein [Acidaminococcus massiliensis]
MNRIILLGRLVRDPEVRVTPTEKTVCTFTLAVDRPFTAKNGQREADFINIVTWNKTAELCGNSLTKGQRALVEGRLQIRSYDGKDGNKHYVTEVIADRVEFIERKGTGNPAGGQQNSPSQNHPSQGGSADPMGGFGSEVGFDEEIPF